MKILKKYANGGKSTKDDTRRRPTERVIGPGGRPPEKEKGNPFNTGTGSKYRKLKNRFNKRQGPPQEYEKIYGKGRKYANGGNSPMGRRGPTSQSKTIGRTTYSSKSSDPRLVGGSSSSVSKSRGGRTKEYKTSWTSADPQRGGGRKYSMTKTNRKGESRTKDISERRYMRQRRKIGDKISGQKSKKGKPGERMYVTKMPIRGGKPSSSYENGGTTDDRAIRRGEMRDRREVAREERSRGRMRKMSKDRRMAARGERQMARKTRPTPTSSPGWPTRLGVTSYDQLRLAN